MQVGAHSFDRLTEAAVAVDAGGADGGARAAMVSELQTKGAMGRHKAFWTWRAAIYGRELPQYSPMPVKATLQWFRL
jgi:hypothetical protein